MKSNAFLAAGFVAALSLSFTQNAAATVLPGLTTPTPTLPPCYGDYGTPSYRTDVGVHTDYPGLSITFADHRPCTNSQPGAGTPTDPIRTQVGANEQEDFPSTFVGMVSVGGGAAVPFTLSGSVQTMVFNKVGNVTGTFNTEMLALSLSGTVGGHTLAIRESPTLASTGQTTITDLGGGLFHINSFFDVFTELSIDGGGFQAQLSGPTRVNLTSVPEPSAFLLTGLGLGLLGFFHKRKAV